MEGDYSSMGLKRPSTGGGPVSSNGGGFGADEDMSHPKKLRVEQQPSKVLHIRNVPDSADELNIVNFSINFGGATNLVLDKGKHNALLEMEDIASAKSMLDFYTNNPPELFGKKMYMQFSNHQELRTDSSKSNAGVQGALQAVQRRMGKEPHYEGQGGRVLHVIVDNVLYPITIETLQGVFSQRGVVEKIIVFTKKERFQALIQMSNAAGASDALTHLNGQNIYTGCCTLQVGYSTNESLSVKYNNDKSRDYTNPSLPTDDSGAVDVGHRIPSHLGASPVGLMSGMGGGMGQMGGGMGQLGGIGLLGNGGGYGGMVSGGAFGGMMGAELATAQGGQDSSTPVLIVSNLNEKTVTPDALFTLFGVYGDVMRVKILFNKKDRALIQFADANQAQTARRYLNNMVLWGEKMNVSTSKYYSVQMPRDVSPDEDCLTKDFSNSKSLHRFKIPNSKNFDNIVAPSPTLHLSNIAASVSEENLIDLFGKHGQVESFKFFVKERKMGLMQMSSTEDALIALIELHNMQLAEQNLKISFARSNTTIPRSASTTLSRSANKG